MTRYDYECRNQSCPEFEVRIEVVKRITEASEPETCPHCRRQMTKLMPLPIASFKGAGFHVNDYPNP